VQRLSEIGAASQRHQRDAIGLLGTQELIEAGIDQHPDRQLVDLGTSIGAALAISTQENALAAAAPANATEPLRRSRRSISLVIEVPPVVDAFAPLAASLGSIARHLNASSPAPAITFTRADAMTIDLGIRSDHIHASASTFAMHDVHHSRIAA